jgi:multidrug transporter EmrE-like cation transporter
MQLYIDLLTRIPNLLLLILAATASILGDYSAKYWSLHQKPIFLILTFLAYFFSAFFYAPTLLKQGLIVTGILWTLFTTLGFVILGLLVFKEQLGVVQISGLMLGVLAVVLLNWST